MTFFFFFNDTATTEIYTLSLHDALPIYLVGAGTLLEERALTIGFARRFATYKRASLIFRDLDRLQRLLANPWRPVQLVLDRKSTRLNSSHGYISYAVFCLKKKKTASRTR